MPGERYDETFSLLESSLQGVYAAFGALCSGLMIPKS